MISAYRYKALRYFTLTFLVTFAFWFAGAYVSFQENARGLHMLLLLPGLMAPFAISLAMIFRSGDPMLKSDYINRLTNLRLVRLSMLPAMVGLMPLAIVISVLISILLGGSTEQLQLAEEFSFTSGFVPVLLLLLMAAAFEELGWRGYAFDSLQSKFTVFKASLIFGILWSLWHLPLMWVNDSYQYVIYQESPWYAVNFFAGIVPLGVIISWICIKNGKSVIAAIAFHFIVNISQEALAITQQTKCIETFVLVGVAAAIVILDKELFFSNKHIMTDKPAAGVGTPPGRAV